jgi:hypothetical protein
MGRRAIAHLVVALGLTACAHRTLPPSHPMPLPAGVRVAVLPFRIAVATPRGAEPIRVPEETGGTAATALADALAERGVAVVPADVVLQAVPGGVADLAAARKLAEQLKANVAAVGTITRYLERNGSALGVTSPASVAYEVVLLRALDGALMGTDRFDYTQSPLNENVLDLPRFIEGGGRWRTREEILTSALRETAERLGGWLGAPRANASTGR